MKIQPLSREQVRQVDQIAIDDFGMSGLVLMENAGRGAAEIIHRISPPGGVAILCGKGNNGGDGYVIARHLQLAGREVVIVSVVDIGELSGDASANATIAAKADIPITQCIVDRPIIVDCLLGTGARGAPSGIYADFVRAANAALAIHIAIDIPTGLDCDTGQASEPTFRADHTITFVASKVGFQKGDANKFTGVIHEVGIGVPTKLLDRFISADGARR